MFEYGSHLHGFGTRGGQRGVKIDARHRGALTGGVDWMRPSKIIVDESGETSPNPETDDHTLIAGHHRLRSSGQPR